MKPLLVLIILTAAIGPTTISFTAADDEQAFLQVDRALFGSGSPKPTGNLLDDDFVWTDSHGNTRNKAQVLQTIQAGKTLNFEGANENGAASPTPGVVKVHVYGQVGIVQENRGNVYILRVWLKRGGGWRALVYQAVATGAPSTADSGTGECENPCETVPFQPRSEEERGVIRAYQAVEQAVAAHDSTAWGAHIADEFFAVTSNSDRPVDKATRMAGLDNQKVAGIAPFPLVCARMFQFGTAMVMVSRQQPRHGLPLHVTRVWFRRNGTWLEAYSYQTTIEQAARRR